MTTDKEGNIRAITLILYCTVLLCMKNHTAITVHDQVYKELTELMNDLGIPSYNSLLCVMIPVMKEDILNQDKRLQKLMLEETRPATE